MAASFSSWLRFNELVVVVVALLFRVEDVPYCRIVFFFYRRIVYF
jgi:hypothetical protein